MMRQIEEPNLMDRTLQLLGECFLASGLIERREVEVDEFGPEKVLLGFGELRVAEGSKGQRDRDGKDGERKGGRESAI
jgi:hypothetical protein